MLISDNARARARTLSAAAATLGAMMALAVYLGMGDKSWQLLVPVLASVAATIWPNRIVVATAMILTAGIVALGLNGTGVLFGASAAALMLALNNLQSNATRMSKLMRRRPG